MLGQGRLEAGVIAQRPAPHVDEQEEPPARDVLQRERDFVETCLDVGEPFERGVRSLGHEEGAPRSMYSV